MKSFSQLNSNPSYQEDKKAFEDIISQYKEIQGGIRSLYLNNKGLFFIDTNIKLSDKEKRDVRKYFYIKASLDELSLRHDEAKQIIAGIKQRGDNIIMPIRELDEILDERSSQQIMTEEKERALSEATRKSQSTVYLAFREMNFVDLCLKGNQPFYSQAVAYRSRANGYIIEAKKQLEKAKGIAAEIKEMPSFCQIQATTYEKIEKVLGQYSNDILQAEKAMEDLDRVIAAKDEHIQLAQSDGSADSRAVLIPQAVNGYAAYFAPPIGDTLLEIFPLPLSYVPVGAAVLPTVPVEGGESKRHHRGCRSGYSHPSDRHIARDKLDQFLKDKTKPHLKEIFTPSHQKQKGCHLESDREYRCQYIHGYYVYHVSYTEKQRQALFQPRSIASSVIPQSPPHVQKETLLPKAKSPSQTKVSLRPEAPIFQPGASPASKPPLFFQPGSPKLKAPLSGSESPLLSRLEAPLSREPDDATPSYASVNKI